MRRDQKKPVRNKTQKKSYGFDTGGRLDTKYKEFKKAKKPASKKFLNTLFIIFTLTALISTAIAGVYGFIKVNEYDSALLRRISNLDINYCKEYEVEKNEGILILTLNDSTHLKTAIFNFFVPTETVAYGFDFTNYEFAIDMAGTKGNLQKYIEINNVFLDRKSIFKYLSNLFYREFSIKVDKVVVQNTEGSLNEYSELYTADLYSKFNPKKGFEKNISIDTDICKSSWNTFVSEFSKKSKNSVVEDYQNNKKISDLFTFNTIKKEQLRIQINNLTGLDRAGSDFADTLQGYGLNVVKVDYNKESKKNTVIYIDRESLKTTQTLLVLKYIIENQIPNPEIKIQNSIFADIYIDMGEDLLAV